ncbi:hypothetical protein QVD17_25015 [Tagetes erecta]|uniref:GRF-type domain-containing protein n=1 Tax=Tagetes erecta TaxID=13708 RepID=A0AAD8KIP5_TARER|nr:hypothetical protein QVD17_25015 [Tagetes erecta]
MVNVLCSCGCATSIRTSWTSANPGRRFHCCVAECGFVSWSDPPMCPRAKSVIPGLLVSLNKSQEFGATMVVENIGMGMQNKRLKMLLFLSWCMFITYLLF